MTELWRGFVEKKWDIFLPVALQPNAGHGLLILEVSRSHSLNATQSVGIL